MKHIGSKVNIKLRNDVQNYEILVTSYCNVQEISAMIENVLLKKSFFKIYDYKKEEYLFISYEFIKNYVITVYGSFEE